MKVTTLENLERYITALEDIQTGPKKGDLEAAPLLDFWSAILIEGSPKLVGIAIGHPSLPRTEVFTSLILFISKDRTYARTLSRWYRLGRKDESNRAGFDRTYIKRLNLKALPNYRRELCIAVQSGADRFGDELMALSVW